MNVKNPFIKWAILVILVIVIAFDIYLILRRKSPPPPPEETGSIIKKQYVEVSKEEPLYKIEKELRDPFKGTVARAWELQDSLKIKQLELELTKAELEKRKLERELARLGYTKYRKKSGYIPLPRLKGIIHTGKGMKALLYFAGKERWYSEGERIGNYKVVEIGEKYVKLERMGKTFTLRLKRGG